MPSARSTAAASASARAAAAAAADAASAARRCASRTRPRRRVDLGAGAALGRQRALVRRARRRRGGLGPGERRLGRRQLGARALGGLPRLLAPLGDLRAARALRGQRGLGVRRAPGQLRRLAAGRERRLAALARARGGGGQLGLVDRRQRALGCAQALGGLDRGVGLHAPAPRPRPRAGRRARARARPRPRHRRGAAPGRRGASPGARRRSPARCRAPRRASCSLRMRASSSSACARRAVISARRAEAASRSARAATSSLSRSLRVRRVSASAEASRRRRTSAICAPERLGALGGRGLQLERLETRAQLALDVAGALEIGGDARELRLGALPAALELAEPRGLLDEPAALVGPRQQHLVDGALGDDAVQLAPQAGLGQQVAHVEAPHRLAVEQVVAVARAVEPAHHGELAARHAHAPVAVVEHELDLADAARGVLLGAREEHVLAGLRADLAGRLRGHRPLQRVGDVGLARAVRPDHDRDAALEAQLDRLAERLEAAQADGAQVHSRPSPSTRSSASWAAACSEAFLEGPSPVPMTSSPSIAAEVKLRRCAGPVASISR